MRRPGGSGSAAALLVTWLACALPAPALAQGGGDDLAAARAATERRDYAAALPIFQQLVQRDGANADLLIEAARVHGWADRNAEAARLYRQALTAAPGRRADILPSLAWQVLWAGDARGALALFEELRASMSGAAAATVLDGLAQARRATGDAAGAVDALREALAQHPGDAGLRRRLAGTLNDTGRHRAALQVLSGPGPGPTTTTPADRAELARTWRWAGYDERALPLLAGQTDPELAWLRDWRIAREVVPYGYATFERASDRDHLTTNASVVGAGWRPAAGTGLEFNLRRAALRDPAGAPDLTQFEVSARSRYGEPGTATGTFWPSIALRVNRSAGWEKLTPTARLKWVPQDGWRFDAEFTRELIEAPRAIANHVSVEVASLGGEWRRDTRQTYAGSVARLRFDDGTTRQRITARGDWAITTWPRWVVGAEAMHFERTADGRPGADARGYWNPRRYAEARLFSALTYERRPFDLQARIGLGSAQEVDGSGTTTRGSPHLWELGLGLDTAPAWRLRLAMGGSGQNLGLSGSGGAGYWRRWANLSLNGWF